MGTHQPIRKIVTPEIPDKLYFRIGDVARLCEVPAYVLRFWETEFPQLKPNKGGTGQRLYRKRDVEMALRIKSLLYDQGYTIPGARQVFKNELTAKQAGATTSAEPAPVSAPQPVATVAAIATVAAATPAASPAAMIPQDVSEPVTSLRRQARLSGLRDDLRSLLGLLSRPVGAPEEGKIQMMRPRLFVEPKPMSRLEPARLQLAQRDLFTLESADPVPPADSAE